MDEALDWEDRQTRRSHGWYELDRLSKKGFNVRNMNRAMQFRINDILDIYPTNRRWHNLETGERGGYETVYKFVINFFKHAKN